MDCSPLRTLRYKIRMESLTVLAIFLLGASVGSLITMIRYRGELGRVREMLEKIQREIERQGEEAA